jgi:hypothetical protein
MAAAVIDCRPIQIYAVETRRRQQGRQRLSKADAINIWQIYVISGAHLRSITECV